MIFDFCTSMSMKLITDVLYVGRKMQQGYKENV